MKWPIIIKIKRYFMMRNIIGEKNEYVKFFLRWLKENKIHQKYFKYILNPKHYNLYQRNNPDFTISSAGKQYGYHLLVSYLISWNSTREGYEYWERLSLKYKKDYRNHFKTA